MSILARIRAKGGDVVRVEWRFRLIPGRLTPDNIAWLKCPYRWWDVREEVWPLLYEWQERAAILQHSTGYPKAEAEARAYAMVTGC